MIENFVKTMTLANSIILDNIYILQYRRNLNNSLVSLRDKYFDCHYVSFNNILNFCKEQNLKYTKKLLSKELLDMIYWFDKFQEISKYKTKIYRSFRNFLSNSKRSKTILQNQKNIIFKKSIYI